MTLLNRLRYFHFIIMDKQNLCPFIPSDLVDIIYNIISKNIYSQIIECTGNETLTLKEIIEKLLNLIDKRRILLPVPLFLENYLQSFFNCS